MPVAQPIPCVPVAQHTPGVSVMWPTPWTLLRKPSAPVPSLSSPEPQQSSQKSITNAATRQSGCQRTSSAGVIHEPLEVSNYCLKFHELLKLEEIAHEQLLEERSIMHEMCCAINSLTRSNHVFLYADVMGSTP